MEMLHRECKGRKGKEGKKEGRCIRTPCLISYVCICMYVFDILLYFPEGVFCKVL